jgi:phosphoribosyl-ATP pyrophosphohydrolase
MTDSIDRLYQAVLAARDQDPAASRTARLLREGVAKMAKKVAEEAVEVGLDAMVGHRPSIVNESADLVYNLVVLWAELGITPDDVWREMDRREQLLGIAEKLPKGSRDGNGKDTNGKDGNGKDAAIREAAGK